MILSTHSQTNTFIRLNCSLNIKLDKVWNSNKKKFLLDDTKKLTDSRLYWMSSSACLFGIKIVHYLLTIQFYQRIRIIFNFEMWVLRATINVNACTNLSLCIHKFNYIYVLCQQIRLLLIVVNTSIVGR